MDKIRTEKPRKWVIQPLANKKSYDTKCTKINMYPESQKTMIGLGLNKMFLK